jgi:hypothetical protein
MLPLLLHLSAELSLASNAILLSLRALPCAPCEERSDGLANGLSRGTELVDERRRNDSDSIVHRILYTECMYYERKRVDREDRTYII